MAAMNASSWGLSDIPDSASAGEPARSSRTRRRSIRRAVGRMLYAALLSAAMTRPEVSAMIIVDRLERDSDGH